MPGSFSPGTTTRVVLIIPQFMLFPKKWQKELRDVSPEFSQNSLMGKNIALPVCLLMHLGLAIRCTGCGKERAGERRSQPARRARGTLAKGQASMAPGAVSGLDLLT